MEITINQKEIENRIYTIRGVQVMLDSHLSEMYGVQTKVLNQAVKRNIDRFPENFMFQLTVDDMDFLRSQIVTSKNNENLKSQFVTSSSEHGGRRTRPYVFTEQGVAMLSAVLRSDTAVKVSIEIMNAFVQMRKMAMHNAGLFQRLDKIEVKQIETDYKFEQIFKALESRTELPDKGVFFDGQIYDAYIFVSDLIKKAETSIIIIDNYIDDTVITLLGKRKKNILVSIYTKPLSKQLELDIKKHNLQYPSIEIKTLAASHDRFLLLDHKELYHLGASLKDLGKKWFAFSRMDDFATEILNRIQKNA